MPDAGDEVKAYLAEIGRKGGQKPSPLKKYESNAARQKAWRDRKRTKGNPVKRGAEIPLKTGTNRWSK